MTQTPDDTQPMSAEAVAAAAAFDPPELLWEIDLNEVLPPEKDPLFELLGWWS